MLAACSSNKIAPSSVLGVVNNAVTVPGAGGGGFGGGGAAGGVPVGVACVHATATAIAIIANATRFGSMAAPKMSERLSMGFSCRIEQ